MRPRLWVGVALAVTVVGAVIATFAPQGPTVRAIDEKILRGYAGVYEWIPGAFVYLQTWDEFGGSLVAFDESGEIRTLYQTDTDHFFAGPGAALSSSVESRIAFHREATGTIVSLRWQRNGETARLARRVDIEKHEEVRFSNGGIRLAGALITPNIPGTYPAIILVHGSGAAGRGAVLPFARFLVRHGIAVLGYDKRGVGYSTGNWRTASADDLASDVVAAFNYLKTRGDIDGTQVGLLGVSQAGRVMPLAAVRATDLAFLISVSGAAVPAAETTIDHARNEMTAGNLPAQMVDQIVALMRLQYEFARTGQGWDQYLALRQKLGAHRSPDTFPGSTDHPYWQTIRGLYFYDPAPTLRQLRVPTLAIFGELDNNILPAKNQAAWEQALKAGGHSDFTLRILPKANHLQFAAKTGTNAEMAALSGFVPEYATTVHDWLARRIKGLRPRGSVRPSADRIPNPESLNPVLRAEIN